MERRKFILNFILWILAFLFGFNYKKDTGILKVNKINSNLGDINAQLADITSDVFNFQSSRYGAKGDGSTSNSNALVKLFNDLNANGGGLVEIPSGTYLIDTIPTLAPISNVQFVGRGQVTFKFTYSGTYARTNIIFKNMSKVSFWGIAFSVPNANLFSLFGDNTNLNKISFLNCTIKDCTPNFLLGANKDILFKDCEWTQSSTPPTTQQGSIGGVQTGQFVVRNCRFNFTFNGHSGVLISVATNSAVLAGLHVTISDCDFMTENLTGYTMDAAIDSEPSGTVPIETLIIRDCKFWNCRCYLTGANYIEIRTSKFRWTKVANNQSNACQINIYNSSSTSPDTGTLRIKEIDIIQDQDTTSTYSTTPIKIQRNVNRLIIEDLYELMNNSGTSGQSFIFEFSGGTIDRLELNDVELNASAANGSISALMFYASTINHIVINKLKVSQQWKHLIAFTGSGTIKTFAVEECDFSDLSLSTGKVTNAWLYQAGGTTIINQRIQNNFGM